MGTKKNSHTSQHESTNRQNGFTIIEVTLFLAVSGLLAVLLLTGWSTMINTQRYKDSVRTLQSFVQQQYNLTYNVENERDDTLFCQTDSQVVSDNGATNNPSKGQSDCVIMGRYIFIKDGLELSVSPIVGHEPSEDQIDINDTEYQAINRYHPKRVEVPLNLTDNTLRVPWDATIVDVSGDTTARNHVIVILRGPTGIVRTYVQKNVPNPDNLPSVETLVVNQATSQAALDLCLDAGNPLSGGRMGVRINKGASSQSSIQTIADGDGVC